MRMIATRNGEPMSKLKQLEKLYPFLKKHKTGSEGFSFEGLPVEQLDLIAILKASQAISENILPEKLNEALIRILMQQAGAGKGYLLFEYDGKLSVVSEGVSNKGIVVQVHDTPLEPDYKLLPEKIFQFVKRTGEIIIIDDASQDKVFGSDKYIEVSRPRSIACLPIIKQGKHLGIIYLENNLIPGAFSADKIAVLKILTSQAAISIENAFYYREIKKLNETLEQRVKKRTEALKKTQATLQLSEEKYRKIVEETGDAVYSSDYKGYFTYVNPVCTKLTGYTENELLGKLFLEIIAPDWKEKVAKFYKEQFDNKVQETSFSFPIITKSGEKKWIEQTVTQLKEGDLITGHNAIVRDITERKKAEEKAKEYQYFFNNSHDLITIANENHFEIINPNFQKVLGYSEKELLEKPFLDFIHPDDLSATLQEIEKNKTGVEAINFRNRYRTKDGNYLLFEWNVTLDPITGKFYASARDITDRKKAEEELKNSNDRFLTLFEKNPIGLVLSDLETRKFLDVNEAFIETFGYTKEEVIGKTTQELGLIEPTDNEKFKSLILKYGYAKDLEALARKKNGETFWSLFSVQIFIMNNKKVGLSSFHNITDRKKAEENIKQKSEELAQSNQELEQFAYVASHDLQEPLRTISNFVGLLGKKYSEKTDEDTKQYFTFIVKATSKMQNLIKDLLEYSRIGKNVVFATVDCNTVYNEVIANLGASIKESNAKITSAILPVLKGNEIELKRLFQNLISNAIKFRKKNVKPEINITVEDKNTEYLFAIKDNGIGIEKQFIPKLFIIFQRLHSDDEYVGTGIGLSACKKIVTLHGGKIWLESKIGEGSTFYFTLPKKNII